jgi:hypothetical protein
LATLDISYTGFKICPLFDFSQMLLNLCLAVLIICLFWFQPRFSKRILARVDGGLRVVGGRPAVTILLVAATPLVVRLLLLPVLPIPSPRIHDEFSYLLAADTFAHGRVTNPTHPLWTFFETYHVLQQPTYMSKYPPAQGLFMAAGQWAFGHPWWGVFFSVGLMCGVVCWMLQAWLPGKWALIGGLAVGLQFGITDYWMNSYWGGAPGAIGGCLLLGGFGRLMRFRPAYGGRIRYAFLMAIGVAILLNSRPWEGMMIALPVAIALVLWLFTGRTGTAWNRVRLVVIPSTIVLSLTAAGMLYYCWRITGNPLSLPYVVCHRTYSTVPLFIWQHSTPPPQYRHAVMERFYVEWEPRYQSVDKLKSVQGWVGIQRTRLRMSKDILFGNSFLLLCVLTLPFLLRDRPSRFLLIVIGFFLVGLSLEGWAQIHYFGPVIGAACAVKMIALRRVSCITVAGKRIGAAVASAIILCSGVYLIRHLSIQPPGPGTFASQRAQIEHDLESKPGSHVVIVRYSAEHNPIQEWVYNGADIDREKVVWARDISPQEDRRLLNYFKDRDIWLLEPDVSPVQLRPYVETAPIVYARQTIQTSHAASAAANP